jgi:hypothetical protein
VDWNLAKTDVVAGWVRLRLLDLVAVMPERLDAISTLLGVEEALAKSVLTAWMPISRLIWGITFTRRPAAINWSRILRPVCRDGVPRSQGKQSVP